MYVGKDTLDARGQIVLPGLINTHTHAPMVLYRGLADDLALMEWLEKYIFPAEAKTVTRDFVRAGTRLAALEMIGSGTTTYADMYYFEEEIARATREAGMRGVLGSAAVLSGSAFVAVAYVLMKRYGRRLHPAIITIGQMLAALPALLTLALIVEGSPVAVAWTSRSIVALLYLAGLGSVAATWLNYWLLKRMDTTKVLLMGIAEVPIAMLIGAVWLGETVSLRAAAGAFLVLVGVSILMDVVPSRRPSPDRRRSAARRRGLR